jgi:zinc transporter 9
LSLLFGFTSILIFEQLSSSHAHSHAAHNLPLHSIASASDVEFDADLAELEREQGVGHSGSGFRRVDLPTPDASDASKKRAYSMMLGLVMHAFADGLALGASALSSKNGESSSVSLVVFLALIIHKGESKFPMASPLMPIHRP